MLSKSFSMKVQFIILTAMLCISQLHSQKNVAVQTSNLNASKSNINRLIYPSTIVTPANAQLILDEMEKLDPMDAERQKTWLASNFKRFGIEPTQVKQITIFPARQYADCTICKQHCTGRCVQDPGADCICFSHSDPNARVITGGKSVNIIYLSTAVVDEATALDHISTAIETPRRVTTVKSSKSNSSE